MIAGRSVFWQACAGAQARTARQGELEMPEYPGPDDLSTPHRHSGLKAAGAVLAMAVVPLALVVGHLPDRTASTTVQPAAGGSGQPLGSIANTTCAIQAISLFRGAETLPATVE